MKTAFFLLLIYCGVGLAAHAQVSSLARLVFPYYQDYAYKRMLTFGEESLINEMRTLRTQDGIHTWRYQKYDTALVLQGEVEIRVDGDFTFSAPTTTEQKVYLFFGDSKTKYEVYTIDFQTLELKELTGSFEAKAKVANFVAHDDRVYCHTIIKGTSSLTTFDLSLGTVEVQEIDFLEIDRKDVEIDKLTFLPDTKELFVSVLDQSSKKAHEQHLYLLKMDQQAQLIEQYNFLEEAGSFIYAVDVISLGPNQYAFWGRNERGILISVIDAQGNLNQAYYPFEEFISFQKYMPKDRRGNLLETPHFFAIHELLKTENGLVLIAEAYYKVKETTEGEIANRVTIRKQYTHMFLASFNATGDLMWESFFRTGDEFQTQPQAVEYDTGAIKVVYIVKDTLYNEFYDLDGEVFRKETLSLSFKDYKDEKPLWTTQDVTYWYDPYYLISGFERIVDKNAKGKKKKRYIYFIEKAALDFEE